jgi:hypothetical protein
MSHSIASGFWLRRVEMVWFRDSHTETSWSRYASTGAMVASWLFMVCLDASGLRMSSTKEGIAFSRCRFRGARSGGEYSPMTVW